MKIYRYQYIMLNVTYDPYIVLACPPKVVPSVKLVFVENERDTEYDTQTVLPPAPTFQY